MITLLGCSDNASLATTEKSVKDSNITQEKDSLSENNSTLPENTEVDKNSTVGEILGDYYIKLSDTLKINSEGTVAVYVSSDINKSEKLIYNTALVKKITKEIYANLDDVYDFIFLITNNKVKPDTVSYSGVFSKVQNDVEGIGTNLYNNTAQFHSSGKLKGVMHFAYRSAILKGPTLHELAHYWANKFQFDENDANGYKLGSGSHWGETSFYGGKGQLGGSYAPTLKDYNYTYVGQNNQTWKLQSAASYGWNANGGNGLAYNDVELYLMGMIQKSDVQDLVVSLPYGLSLPQTVIDDPDFQDLVSGESGRRYFMAVETQRKSWSTLLSEHGVPDRNPDYITSQKSFRILTVLLDSHKPETYALKAVHSQVKSLAFKGDDLNANNFNFWEATREIGSLEVNNLLKTLKVLGEKVYITDIYKQKQITFHSKVYQTVRSKYTHRIWLDRNIGASRVCQSFDDEICFGDYFQWGRGFDGHEKKEGNYTTTKSNTLNNTNEKFVIVRSATNKDWLESGVDDNNARRVTLWSTLDGSSVCPAGFRVPTVTEYHDETDRNEFGDAFKNNIDAFEHFLKFPSAGYRNPESSTAAVSYFKTDLLLWTATLNGNRPSLIHTDSNSIYMYSTSVKSMGLNIRCIKE